MTLREIHLQLRHYHDAGKKIFVTSSFQTHSIPLLHILSQSGVPVDVLFINTGFHFPETLAFRDEVVELLKLKLINVRPLLSKAEQKNSEGQFYFVSDPDYCCYLNKTQAMEPWLMRYDVWVNGVRADQSDVRRNMKVEEKAPFGTLRFHPLLDWSVRDVYRYKREHKLPGHPLDRQGYLSIGCAPCTRRMDPDDVRSGRWYGLKKTECGLHTDLISK